MSQMKLYRVDVAQVMDVKITSLSRYKLPERDGTDVDSGKARPFWYLETIQKWMAQRPGRGFRTDRTVEAMQSSPGRPSM
jgi:hypothetical protein